MSMHKGICGQSEGGATCKQRVAPVNPEGFSDKTLAEYIQRKYREEAFNQVKQETKMTFDEWFTKNWDWSRPLHREDIEDVWQAAQENM